MNTETNIGKYITLAEELINKYDWNTSVKKDLTDRLEKIHKKHKDKKLNLSVIGEFSVGKSTFINALLRNKLLQTAMLGGTTVASTVIEHSSTHSMIVKYKDKRSHRFMYQNIKQLSAAIDKYGATPEFAKNVESLSVYCPSNSGLQDIRIIDTPGTNAENWHNETTERAIKELSDASIILIDPTKPLPATQKNFIHENLEDVLEQCIFVVTKIDIVRKKERERTLEYIKQQISYEFDLDNPFVIFYASQDVLDNAIDKNYGSNASEDKKSLISDSFQNESALYLHIANQKSITQTKRIIMLLEDMYSHIDEQIVSVSDSYKREHEILERTQKTNLRSFVNSQVNERTMGFDKSAEAVKNRIITNVSSSVSDNKKQILSAFESCSNADSLKNFVNNTFSSLCNEKAEKIMEEANNQVNEFNSPLTKEIECFRQCFTKNYKNLGLLPMDESRLSTELNKNSLSVVSVSTGNVGQQIQASIESGNKKMGGGAAAGAAIGTAVLPGVGTIVGGILGAIGGWLFAPEISDLKSQSRGKLTDSMNNYFDKIENICRDNLDSCIADAKKQLTDSINRYYAEYNAFVQESIKADQRKKQFLENRLETVKSDMDEISKTKAELITIRQNLTERNRRN